MASNSLRKLPDDDLLNLMDLAAIHLLREGTGASINVSAYNERFAEWSRLRKEHLRRLARKQSKPQPKRKR